jgi:hypothetical protein
MNRGDVERAYSELSALLDATDSLTDLLELHALCTLELSCSSEAISDLTTLLSSATNPISCDRLAALRGLAYLRVDNYHNALRDCTSFFAPPILPHVNEAVELSSLESPDESTIRRLVTLSLGSRTVLLKAADFYASVG